MAPRTTNRVKAVALLIPNSTWVIPWIDPKHKRERKIKSKIDQIKEKIDGLTVKKSIKSWNNSDMNRSKSFKPKFTDSDSRSNWRELEMEPGFGQEFKNWGRSNQLIYVLSPQQSRQICTRNISPSVDRSCSFGLNGSYPEQMSERKRMKTFPECHRHLEYFFDCEPVYLQTHQSYQKIIYLSILVTKESNNMYMWNQNNSNVGQKSALH